jgi:hypothetical protein
LWRSESNILVFKHNSYLSPIIFCHPASSGLKMPYRKCW